MSHCTRPDIGLLLHAFELGMLPKEQRQEFEEHLLECTYCFELAKNLEEYIKALNTDEEIHRQIIESVSDKQEQSNSNEDSEKSEKSTSRVSRTYLWISLAAVLVMVSVFQFSGDQDTSPASVQTITFSELRASSASIIYLDSASLARFELPVGENIVADSVRITISSVAGKMIVDNQRPVEIKAGYLIAEIPVTLLRKDLYEISVETLAPDGEKTVSQFTFRAK